MFSNFEIPIFFICSIVMNIVCPFRIFMYMAMEHVVLKKNLPYLLKDTLSAIKFK